PKGWHLLRCMRHLATPAALAAEGSEMLHCVAGYDRAVESGQSVILSITVREHRSTVELRPNGEVLQHKGRRNSDPHDLCKKALNVFLIRNRLMRRRPSRQKESMRLCG